MSSITPIVLCGGSGTRLWPLSRRSLPKQFVPLIDGKSLLSFTLERAARLASRVVVVAAEEHRFLVADELQEAGLDGIVVLESKGRNTAPAMTLAALRAAPEEFLLFCPADHHIPDADEYVRAALSGLPAAAAGMIVLFGVVPTSPSSAYGYIRHGEPIAVSGMRISQFIEKPNAIEAQRLLLEGGVYWNAGIFLIQARVLLDAMSKHAPDILEACRAAVRGEYAEKIVAGARSVTFVRPAQLAFEQCRAASIDYAVMEHNADSAVVPFRGQWSDMGSWNAVACLSVPDSHQNRIQGQGIARDARNTFIHAPHRPVVALGTSDLLIIDTPDAVLVANSDSAEAVKEVVVELEKENTSQAIMHRKVHRPWGWYDGIDQGERFQVKRIGVKPGAALSLQKHHHRAEHWIVVSGMAEVTRGSETFLLHENESTYIPIGEVHRLRNPGHAELQIIEVQSGDYLGEDDIVRLDDHYGRSTSP